MFLKITLIIIFDLLITEMMAVSVGNAQNSEYEFLKINELENCFFRCYLTVTSY